MKSVFMLMADESVPGKRTSDFPAIINIRKISFLMRSMNFYLPIADSFAMISLISLFV